MDPRPPLTIVQVESAVPIGTVQVKWTRDRLVDQAQPVGRVAIGFVVKELSRTNAPLNRDVAPTADEIAEALFSSIAARAAEAGLPLSDEEVSELMEWMSVSE